MADYFVLNPEGNNGKGRITRYIGRGAVITRRINLIDQVVNANRRALALLQEAEARGEDQADITEPAQVFARAKTELALQAANN